ncbi:MAG: response regulator transcription factor [Cellulophaga sp.]
MSQTLKCIIVDDEPPALRLLEKYVLQVPFLECIATFTNPLEALKEIEAQEVDLVFLDIQMPEITGIQLSKILNKQVKVIFTTAYPQFAIEGFELNAVDYLLKPIDFDRFYTAVQKVKTETVTIESAVSDACFFFKTDGKNNYEKVHLNDISHIEGLKNYVSIYVRSKRIITYNTLKYLQENLPTAQFVQIHKSYIVSLQHIDKIENDLLWIGDKELSIGNTFKKAFFERIAERRI